MLKSLKKGYKTNKLKQQLLKNNMLFDFNALSFSKRNVLIIDEIIPEYNKDSGSRRLTEIIKILLNNGISVFLMADLKQYKYKSDYIGEFKDLGVNVYEPSIDEKGELLTKKAFINRIASGIDIAWLHRPLVFHKYQDQIKKANPKIKLIFDMVDFHYIRLLREYELDRNEKLKKETAKFLRLELENCRNADKIIAISTTDKISLKEHYESDDKVAVISNIHQYLKRPVEFVSFKNRKDILFVGSFRHQPNKDAVLYLRNEIMPIVWNENPDIKVNIVGSYVTEEIKLLKSDNFKIIGFVDDLGELFSQSKLFVAPLRFGAGIKGKIGQSLEYGLPLVTTDVGAEGFDFGSKNELMIANDKVAIAEKIIELYQNESSWNEASNYCETILKPFSIDETEKSVMQVINV